MMMSSCAPFSGAKDLALDLYCYSQSVRPAAETGHACGQPLASREVFRRAAVSVGERGFSPASKYDKSTGFSPGSRHIPECLATFCALKGNGFSRAAWMS